VRFALWVPAAVCVLAGPVYGQSTHGYVFAAPGGATSGVYTSMTLNFGVGVEARLAPHVGAGIEGGGLGFTDSFASSVMGVISPNGYFHFKGAKGARVDPYVTGGYTAMFRYENVSMFNVGGGVNIWPRQHLGLKLEVRDHVDTRYDTIHYWGFRFGLTFK